MFQVSEIAKKFIPGRTKASYIINLHLFIESSPSFVPAPSFVSFFDEAFNGVTKQSDLHLISFDEVKLQVTGVYLNSQFMGHGSSTDPVETCRDVMGHWSWVFD